METMLFGSEGFEVRHADRAERLPLGVRLRYRLPTEANWRTGKVENISRSGLLFRTDKRVGKNLILDLSIELPSKVPGQSSDVVVFRAQVVRTMFPPESHRPGWIAVAFMDGCLVRGESARELVETA